MRKLGVLAALAFALAGSTIYARACDTGAITAYVTGTVVADCSGSACSTMSRSRPPHNRCLLRRRLLTAAMATAVPLTVHPPAPGDHRRL